MIRRLHAKILRVLICIVIGLVISSVPLLDSLPVPVRTDTVMAAGDFIYFPYPVYTVSEGCQTADILIMRKRTSLWLITANYATSDLTALAGQDYTAVQGTKTMTMFLQDSLQVPITDDATGEANEEFTITLTGQYTLDDPANGYYKSCTVIIEDNDGGASLSDNNYLSSLETNTGIIAPQFVGTTQNYEVNLADTISSISFRAVTEESSAEMTLEGTALLQGTWSNPVSLQPGQNVLELAVEAENGDIRTYEIIVNRDILPTFGILTVPLASVNGNTINIGNNMEFEGSHTLTIQDNSTTGWGWRLWLCLDRYIEAGQGEVDDPEAGGDSYLEIAIPSEAVCTFQASEITRPGQTSQQLNEILDVSGAPLVSEVYRIEAFSESSGIAGEYILSIGQLVSMPTWLPPGSVITKNNGMETLTIESVDMKQIFAADYNFGITYELERIVPP